jgi:hypothetical protein
LQFIPASGFEKDLEESNILKNVDYRSIKGRGSEKLDHKLFL